MQQFIDNLISRLEEKIFSAELHDCGWEGQTAHNLLTLGDVRDAAEQLAEEYKGGWIPCSERLPKNDENVLVWFEYFRFGEYNRLYQTHGISHTFRGEWSGFVNGQSGWSQLRVIAWMPLPTQYQKEGE